MEQNEMIFNAVSVELPSGKMLYAFPIDGKKILDIASVSRLQRDEKGVSGFQRDIVKKHIKEIADYVSSAKGAMIPNAIVIAFADADVRFDPISNDGGGEGLLGILHVKNRNGDESPERKPGWIVDGQQRTYAILEAKVDRFPIMVCAFIESDRELQAEQFVNVNNVKPLPRTLINELLPGLSALPERLKKRRAAAILAEKLAFDVISPLHGIVKSQTVKEGVVQLNSLIAPIEDLLNNPTSFIGGHVDPQQQVYDLDDLFKGLVEYWSAVKEVFAGAWGLAPSESRLMHGTGIWAMFQLMSLVMDDIGKDPEAGKIAEKLSLIAPFCHWTEDSGDWENVDGFDRNEPWNSFQNTAQHKKLLTAFLSRKYRETKYS